MILNATRLTFEDTESAPRIDRLPYHSCVRTPSLNDDSILRSSLPLMVAVQGAGVFVVIGLGGLLELLAEPGRR